MEFWIIATLVLSLLSPISYTKSMLRGQSKPHRVTRFVILLASVAGVLGIIGSSNMAGIVFALIFLARAAYLFIMSLIYGVGGAAKLDIYCLLFGVAAIIVYATTGSGLLAISFGILADVIAYIPTFIKTYKKPSSEDPLFFGIEGLASLFAVFAIWELRVDILFPIYFVLCCVIMLGLIYRKKLTNVFNRSTATGL